MNRQKAIIIALLALILIIVIFQNTEIVQTRILFVTIQMPRALLLFTATVVGFVVGVFLGLSKNR